MTNKRRQLLELLAQGWSVRSACTKFVPPLEPLAARMISSRFLSEAERIQIADLASRGLGPTAIGLALGRAPSTRLLHLPAYNSTELLHALVRTLNELPPPSRRTVTWDQGTEMARHLEITQATGTRIYFCDSAGPSQRGSNENTNGLLRQYFPKSTDLSIHTARDLARVENELNRRPRITLGDRAPADLFAALLASEDQPSLR